MMHAAVEKFHSDADVKGYCCCCIIAPMTAASVIMSYFEKIPHKLHRLPFSNELKLFMVRHRIEARKRLKKRKIIAVKFPAKSHNHSDGVEEREFSH